MARVETIFASIANLIEAAIALGKADDNPREKMIAQERLNLRRNALERTIRRDYL